ncbi:MAG: DUF1295 domain-containing protein [Gammaproteobacteria bacterium]|nr:DUF1295 domain-containing protein [Gammaproteobacteria bacterium]
MDWIDYPLAGTPFGTALVVCLILAATAWVLSLVTREVVWVDRAWSICPPVYCLIVVVETGFESMRLNLMALLVVLWGVRLTYNFARKGGFKKGGEDYRWAHLRERVGPVVFQILNITFIAPGQMLLIWLFTSPIHQAWRFQEAGLNGLDLLAAALFVVFLVGETVADQQMWNFQQAKKRRLAAGEPVAEPFVTTGLFRYCRHPNFLCELGMWWTFYLFAVAASGEWLHWTALGFIALTAQFIASMRMGESISAAKYPGYRAYQATTPALIPLRRRQRRGP